MGKVPSSKRCNVASKMDFTTRENNTELISISLFFYLAPDPEYAQQSMKHREFGGQK